MHCKRLVKSHWTCLPNGRRYDEAWMPRRIAGMIDTGLVVLDRSAGQRLRKKMHRDSVSNLTARNDGLSEIVKVAHSSLYAVFQHAGGNLEGSP